ncbi:MAG: DUF459 domain-containing protein [Pseudolabrys sp.]
MLAVLECAAVAAVGFAWTAPAQAQGWRSDYPYAQRRPRSGGFFQQLFGPYHPRQREYKRYREQRPVHVDHSRAPSPHKRAKDAPPAATTIVVMGDGMAGWLAYGLEKAFSDTPSVEIVRKDKVHSGLIQYQRRSDLDWWHVARDILSQQKASYVVMMLGLNDRKNIRESDVAREAEKQQAEKEAAEKKKQEKNADKNADKDKKDADKKKAEAAKPKPKPPSNGVIEFRSDRWAKVYSRWIDKTIAALKSKGVPVFWVGLPSIRGTKSTADAVYLNDLFRARAERAGIVYIDVWDGFVDDAGKYSSYGPDYEGQMRRLRSADGVYFTKHGARKLAHYVEREIRRYMSNRSLQVNLPTGPETAPKGGKSAARPVVGPVVPLTGTTGTTDELLGGAGTRAPRGDATVTRALVNGEPVQPQPGRADDFAWPPGSGAASAAKPAAGGQQPAADQRSSSQQSSGKHSNGKHSSKASTAARAAPPHAPAVRPISPPPTASLAKPGAPQSPAGTAVKRKAESAQQTRKAQETARRNGPTNLLPPADVKPRPAHSTPHRQHSHFPFPFRLDNPFGLFR